mgnify:CR=1 FL=1|jgi:hypothetical protein|tara:strand:+ start:638 stop:1066 length:429 start_codon:yes stop_codon:yes gene_type:complete
MENIKQLIFSFYFINDSNEIDMITNKQYKLNIEGILTQKELLSEIIKQKCEYKYKVHLHEILLYNNTEEPVSYYANYENENYFDSVNAIQDIVIPPTHVPFHSLTKLYIFLKTKTNTAKSKKKKKNSNTTRKNNLNIERIFK